MSKANQKFVQADEAVSPVIGVILMVAITVVLAAVVFVLVSNLSEQSDSAPTVAFTLNDSEDRLSVVRADNSIQWADFRIRADKDIRYDVNGDATNADSTLNANTYETVNQSGDVAGGDYIDLCASSVSSAASVTVTILHIETNTVVFEEMFTTLSPCT